MKIDDPFKMVKKFLENYLPIFFKRNENVRCLYKINAGIDLTELAE